MGYWPQVLFAAVVVVVCCCCLLLLFVAVVDDDVSFAPLIVLTAPTLF